MTGERRNARENGACNEFGVVSALTRCLEEEAAAIAAAAQHLSSSQVEAALELLEGCRERRATARGQFSLF